jgi:hypothetical protein
LLNKNDLLFLIRDHLSKTYILVKYLTFCVSFKDYICPKKLCRSKKERQNALILAKGADKIEKALDVKTILKVILNQKNLQQLLFSKS